MMGEEGLMEALALGELLELERCDGVDQEEMGGYLLCAPPSISPSSSSSTLSSTAQMLCFSGAALAQKSSDSSSLSTLSSSPPSITTTSNGNSAAGKSSKVVEDSNGGGCQRTLGGATTAVNASKKLKTGASGTIKVRKEKLGERITALQQLVSPFGKSDTASVLHEALGYIRFLHDQVQVLSSPYLQRLPQLHGGERGGELRRRGLCLVPISCTEHVADSNGADLWSSPMGSNDYLSGSSSKH